MLFFDKLTQFRRLSDSVPFYRSRKNYYSRFLSRLMSFNIDSDFSFINLENKRFPEDINLRLVDVVTVKSLCSEQVIVIHLFVCIILNDINQNLFYKVYV